jgi:hypothetical protein
MTDQAASFVVSMPLGESGTATVSNTRLSDVLCEF